MLRFGRIRTDHGFFRTILGQQNQKAPIHLIAHYITGLYDCGALYIGCFGHVAQRTVLLRAFYAVQLKQTNDT